MVELISTRYVRKARKNHKCNYCSKTIEVGESYKDGLCKDGIDIYHWKSCPKCGFFAHELWDYIDPDWGLDGDGLVDGMDNFLREFICPNCENWSKDYQECDEDNNSYECKDKIYNILKIKKLEWNKNKGFWNQGSYILVDRDEPIDEYSYNLEVKEAYKKK